MLFAWVSTASFYLLDLHCCSGNYTHLPATTATPDASTPVFRVQSLDVLQPAASLDPSKQECSGIHVAALCTCSSGSVPSIKQISCCFQSLDSFLLHDKHGGRRESKLKYKLISNYVVTANRVWFHKINTGSNLIVYHIKIVYSMSLSSLF